MKHVPHRWQVVFKLGIYIYKKNTPALVCFLTTSLVTQLACTLPMSTLIKGRGQRGVGAGGKLLPSLPVPQLRYPGGTQLLFSGRGVRSGFLKYGACGELIFAAENFQIWGLWAKIWVKIEAVEAEISRHFLKRGPCELTLLLEMGPLWTTGEAWKRGLQGRTSPYPFLGQCPRAPIAKSGRERRGKGTFKRLKRERERKGVKGKVTEKRKEKEREIRK